LKKPCPICKLPEQPVASRKYSDKVIYNCSRCGRFVITSIAEEMADTRPINPKLSAWIRDRNEKDVSIPEINPNRLEEIPASLPDYSPSERQLILLRNIERKTKYPGYLVNLVPVFDVPLAWASDLEELIYYLQSLKERNLLKFDEDLLIKRFHRLSPLSSFVLPVKINPDGWDYLEEKATKLEDKTQVFVAMSFSSEMKPSWNNSFRPAISKAGYKAYRIDVKPHIDRIDAKIITEIKNSRFLVADVTE